MFAGTWIAAVKSAWRYRDKSLARCSFFAALTIRSMTGTTIELAGYFLVFFLLLAVSMRPDGDRASDQEAATADADLTGSLTVPTRRASKRRARTRSPR